MRLASARFAELTLSSKLDIIRTFVAAHIPRDVVCNGEEKYRECRMFSKGNYAVGLGSPAVAVAGFILVCGAMRRNHLIKE